MKKIFVLCLFFLCAVHTSLFSQWEVYGGYSHTNLISYLNGQSMINLDPPNAPNTLSNIHFGVGKNILLGGQFYLNVALGYAGRGTRDYARLILRDTVIKHRLEYLQAPISVQYKIIRDKDYFLILGFTPSYLIRQSEIESGFPVLPTPKNFQMEYRVGMRLPIYKNIHGGVAFSRSITKVDRIESTVPIYEFKKFNHAFDFSLIYKF